MLQMESVETVLEVGTQVEGSDVHWSGDPGRKGLEGLWWSVMLANFRVIWIIDPGGS